MLVLYSINASFTLKDKTIFAFFSLICTLIKNLNFMLTLLYAIIATYNLKDKAYIFFLRYVYFNQKS